MRQQYHKNAVRIFHGNFNEFFYYHISLNIGFRENIDIYETFYEIL